KHPADCDRSRKQSKEEIMKSIAVLIVIGAAIFALAFYSPATSAQTRSAKPSEEAVRAQNAANVLSEIMAAPDQGIPDALLKEAYGIAVIPHVVKGAIGIGGSYGKGLVAE